MSIKSRLFILIGAAMALAFWLVETSIHCIVFDDGSFGTCLVEPDANELWMRSLIVIMLISFGIIAQHLNDKRVRAEARRGEEQFKALVDSSPVAIAVHQGGLWVYANDAAIKLIGGTRPVEVVGRPVLDFVHPDDHVVVQERMRQLSEGGPLTPRLEERLVRLDGQSFLAEVNALRVEFDGEPAVMVVVRDLDEHRRSEMEIKQSEYRLNEAQQVAHLGSWELDLVENNLWWSDENYRVFGMEPGSGNTYQTFLETVHPDDRAYVDREYSGSVENRTPYNIEHRLLLPDGSVKWVNERCRTIYADDGSPLRSIGTTMDITEHKQAEIALIRANRALRTISDCNSVLVRATCEADLLSEMCRVIVESGGYMMVWVGEAVSDAEKSVRPVAQYGDEQGYLDEVNISWGNTEHGQGPTGSAIRTGKTVVNHDCQHNPKMAPWRDAAIKRGYQASIALPLIVDKNVLGAIAIYASEPNAFSPEEVTLLEELASDLSYGIGALRTDIERQHARDALADNEQKMSEILEHDSDGILVVNMEREVLFANPAAEQLLGRSGKNLLKYPFTLPIAPGEVSEVVLTRPGMKSLSAEIHAVTLNWAGQPAHVVFLHDMTVRVASEDERRKHDEKIQLTLENAVGAVAMAMEKRDPYTAGHQRRVSDIAVAIAGELGLDEESIKGIRLGGVIHDIGKIYVPSELLTRPGRLTIPEYEIIKTHSQVGYEIIKGIDFPWPVADMVHQHHERLDGSGYPQGLKGDEIILEARILAVADVLEAMVAHRPYRAGLGIELALEELKGNRGVFYDEKVVDACLKLLKQRVITFE